MERRRDALSSMAWLLRNGLERCSGRAVLGCDCGMTGSSSLASSPSPPLPLALAPLSTDALAPLRSHLRLGLTLALRPRLALYNEGNAADAAVAEGLSEAEREADTATG
jgi:hypothetical protein